MITFKIVVRNLGRSTKSGNYAASIRLTHNRQSVFIPTPVQILPQQVSKKGEITDPRLLVALNRRIMDIQAILLDLGIAVDQYSAAELKALILRKEEAASRPLRQGIDLLAFWREEFLPSVRQKRTQELYATSMRRFARFVRQESINTSTINLRLIREYEEHLRRDGVGARGINLYLTHLKRVFMEAKVLYNDEDTGTIVISNNPFSKYKIPLPPPAKKEGTLSREQLLAIINHEAAASREELARDCFTMSLFLAGINTADLYNAVKLSKAWVLEFERTKTKTRRQDRALQRITVPECLRPLFERYRDRTGQRLLNFHVRYANEHELNRAVNMGLKEIGAKAGIDGLYYYQARHSFASIAHNRLRYSLEDVGKCLTHVPMMKVTDGYVEQDYSIVDEVNQAVMRWIIEPEDRTTDPKEKKQGRRQVK